jgi:uncharacterized protein (DUF952 family)
VVIDGDDICHIALLREWQEAIATGWYRRSTRGLGLDEVGFVHCARSPQVPGVLARFYADETEPLVLLTVDRDRLGSPVLDEADPATGELFPHVYGPIPVTAVRSVEPVEAG